MLCKAAGKCTSPMVMGDKRSACVPLNVPITSDHDSWCTCMQPESHVDMALCNKEYRKSLPMSLAALAAQELWAEVGCLYRKSAGIELEGLCGGCRHSLTF